MSIPQPKIMLDVDIQKNVKHFAFRTVFLELMTTLLLELLPAENFQRCLKDVTCSLMKWRVYLLNKCNYAIEPE